MLKLHSTPLFRCLVGVIVFFALTHLVVTVLHFEYGYDYQLGMRRQFDLNEENNLPTFFSALLLLGGAAAAGLAARYTRRIGGWGAGYWLGLALIFAFLAIDEATQIHELVGRMVRESLDTSGVLYYAWIIPYGAFAAIVGLLYLRFLRRIPPPISRRLLLAGGIFVSGAVGMELIQGHLHTLHGTSTLLSALTILVEETMEMIGSSLFLVTTLRYFEEDGAVLAVSAVPHAAERMAAA